VVRSILMGLAVAAGLAGAATQAEAQFAAGQRHVGVHVGLSGVGSAAAIGVNAELAYTDQIGIGLFADTWSYGQSWGSAFGGGSWDVRYVALAGTGAYHFRIEGNPKLDPFLGATLGYYIVNTESSASGAPTYDASSSRMFLGGYGGIRYFLNDRLSGVARAGVGASYLTLGVDLKL
jgi:hypothetical protein